jgi:aminoglycoside/choline kinase family phosphotransferase
VVKLPSPDPTSSETGFALRNYEREVKFYTEIADALDVRRPDCLYAELDLDARHFVLVLEDLAPAQQGNQITGCGVDQARLAVAELVGLHAPRWGDPALGDIEWLSRREAGDLERLTMIYSMFWPAFAAEYREVLSTEALELGAAFPELFAGWFDARAEDPQTLTHGDYRLDNMLFGTPSGGSPVAVVDWQTPGHGPASSDVSYFLGAGLLVPDRREHERSIIDGYIAAMADRGVQLDPDVFWRQYSRDAFAGVLMSVIASQVVGKTERGHAMFCAMTERHFQHALDLDARSLVM